MVPVAGEVCNWWFKMFIYFSLSLRDLCISLIVAPKLCFLHSTDGGKGGDGICLVPSMKTGKELASEVILVLGNSAWLFKALVMQWEKCNQRTWVTELNF